MKFYRSIAHFDAQPLEKKIMVISKNCDEIIKNFLAAKVGLENKKIVNSISERLTDVSAKIVEISNLNCADNSEENNEFLSQKSSLIYTYLVSMHQKVMDLTKYRNTWMLSDDMIIEAKPSHIIKSIDKIEGCQSRLYFFKNPRQFEVITMMEKKELIKENILKLKTICLSIQDNVIIGMLDEALNKCKVLPNNCQRLNLAQMISANRTYAAIYEQTKVIYQVLADIVPLREKQTILKPIPFYKSGDVFFAKRESSEVRLPIICEFEPILSFE